ncbi:MAG TPA: hypothetical protein PKL73_25455 [Polyangiaceae bacterium]|nr:MAG: hypothetical protein BWY17_02170 [Deltaproteobacteria bacterium ADurb.Bin207]HNT00335.1 hypothetical protein [Polyangiaceae bacterium]HNZ22070.1 hypothetical protein [Polyangiaceae bacterium]HOD22175.1 hypothetical protein [Polyangiaceae bacterium]HOE47378.1 hypothetical protein [Polyangiaceae bacterium]
MNRFALAMGGRLALQRLRGRSTLLIAATSGAFCTLAAWAERHADPASAASHALRGASFGLIIPLATLAVVTLVFQRHRPDDAVGCAAVLGANRRLIVVGALLATSIISAFLGLVIAALTVLVAFARIDALVVTDLLTSAWIGALSGLGYTWYFGAASTLGRRGGGRWLAWVFDWLFGSTLGVGATLFPKSHLLNLLGAEPVMGLTQKQSFAALLGIAFVSAAVLVARIRK